MLTVFIAGGKAAAAIASAEDGEVIVKVALEKFGGVHVLVANAGILRDKSFTAMTEKDWDDVIAVHLRWVCAGFTKVFIHTDRFPVAPIGVQKPSGQFSRSRSTVAS